jgi:hypothetical protein
MLFKSHILEQIRTGEVTIAFRRWRKPTVKPAGRLRTPIGELAILKVEITDPAAITGAEAKRAGFASVDALLREIDKNTHAAPTDPVYKITFDLAGPDSREALRADDKLSDAALDGIKAQLNRLDEASACGNWTAKTLTVIKQMPSVRARLLAQSIGMEAERFKTNVRKLKNLGLTESLGTGYKLSPRGEVVLKLLIDNKT